MTEWIWPKSVLFMKITSNNFYWINSVRHLCLQSGSGDLFFADLRIIYIEFSHEHFHLFTDENMGLCLYINSKALCYVKLSYEDYSLV